VTVNGFTTWVRIGAAALAIAVASQARAEATADEADEEIIVTAQFREQDVQSAPLAITVVSGELADARGQTNISQIAYQTPNVTLKPQGQSYGPSLGASIRGVGQFDFNPALEPGVGIYVDDVYYATLTGSIVDLLDLERVEILRGPQGTLAGKNSIGGAVKLYSRKPQNENSGSVKLGYGSRDRVDLRGMVNLALSPDLAIRLAGVSKMQGGYVKRIDYGCAFPGSGIPPTGRAKNGCRLARDGNVDYQGVRGQARYTPSSDLEINLAADYSNDHRRTPGSVLTFFNYTGAGDINPYPVPVSYTQFLCGKYCNYATFEILPDDGRPGANFTDRSTFKGYGFSGHVDWKIGNHLTIQSISAYRHYRATFTNDDDASPLAHSLGFSDLRFHSFSQELRAIGTIASVDYAFGLFYLDQKSVYKTQQILRYASPPGVLIYGDDPVKANTKALFGHITWHATDRLSLMGGLRYTDEKKTYAFIRKNPDGTPNSAVDGVVGTYDGPTSDRIDYRAAVQFDLSDGVMTYAQYSTGFKGGGVSPRPFAPLQVRSFGPEKIGSWEAGLKTDLWDHRARISVAAFLSNYKGVQLSLGSCPEYNPTPPGPGAPFPCALVNNAADARIKGLEAEAALRPLPDLSIEAALSYLDFKYKAGSIPPAAGGPPRPAGPQYGNRPAYVPNWKWSIGAQYEADIGARGTITPRLDLAWQGDMFGNASNRSSADALRASNKIPGYLLANARISWKNRARDLEVAVEVTNLFDKYYFLTLFDLTPNNAGVAVAQPGRPREWALTATRKF
jgi:iron complex outermembrane receptor protein